MNVKCMLLALVLASVPGFAKAQFPDQFYTNGTKIDVWRAEERKKSILWFSREPGDKIVYRQSVVIIYNDHPEYAYYVNLGTRKFVGRYSFEKDKYSVLPVEHQREDINDIPADAFPPLGDLPTVRELLAGSENEHKLLEPPPTKEYNRLRASSWDSAYFTTGRKRIKTKVTFRDNEGEYTFSANGTKYTGSLADVSFGKTDEGLFEIKGTWKLEGQQGYFKFAIAPEDLNSFQGEWGRNGVIEGTWSGSRVRDE